MLSNFDHLLPEVIFESVEKLGGRCTGRFLALNAMENRVYDVEMEEGPHLVVKFYRPGRWSQATVQAEHDFLKKVEAAEVPVVCPLSDSSGQTLFTRDEIFYAVFPKRPGRLEPELNKEQLTRLGRYLARIHNVGDTVKNAPRGKLTPKTYGTDSLKILQDQKVLTGNLGNIYSQLVREIVERSEPLFEGQETTLLHGDCHAGNILWRGDEPYFIDFDDMLYAPPVQDFWMMIGGDDEYAMKNRDILIDAYLEIRDFDERTWKLVEPLRALRMIYFNAWIANRKDDGAFKQAFPHFGTEQYWQQQIENLSMQLERVKTQTDKLVN
ncbi:MAG: serine/threonine protein kinase [Proteobacteria bacterium]|nr:serine/threonine protein kinase [Pseudomonadota bacterium]